MYPPSPHQRSSQEGLDLHKGHEGRAHCPGILASGRVTSEQVLAFKDKANTCGSSVRKIIITEMNMQVDEEPNKRKKTGLPAELAAAIN